MLKDTTTAIIISIGIIFASLVLSPDVFTFAAAQPLQNRILTNYWPVKGGGTQTMEGGWVTSRPGLNGKNTPSTLEMVRTGQSNYVTIAADKSYYGKTYNIPEITYVNAKGEKYTLYNVKAYVHDTGGAFMVRPKDSEAVASKKLRKFDIATDATGSDAEAAKLDRLQPSKKNVEFVPTDGTTGEPTTVKEEEGGGGPGQTPEEGVQQPVSTGKPISQGIKISPNYGGSPLWQTSPQCYKHQGNPSGPRVYYFTPTCNAGYKWEGDSIVYYPDCGYRNSVGCDEWLSRISGVAGCLWAVCKGNNAIWDPQTKRCGCDDASPVSHIFATADGQVEIEYGRDSDGISNEEDTTPYTEGEKVSEGFAKGASERNDLSAKDVKTEWETFNETQQELGKNGKINYDGGSFRLEGFPEKGVKSAEELALASDSTLTITSARRGTYGNHAFGAYDISRSNTKMESYLNSVTKPVTIYDSKGMGAKMYTFKDSSGGYTKVIDEPTGWGGNSGAHWHVDPNNGQYRTTSK